MKVCTQVFCVNQGGNRPMKKSKYLLAALLMSGLVLTGCNPASSGGGSTPVEPGGGGDPDPEVEEYVIRVTAPAGINYSLNKEKAAKGEDIVLTINSVEKGMTIKKVVMNSTTLTSGDGGKTYTFKMPNQSALINFEVDVAGEVTLIGEVSAVLTQEASGIYVARNVSVPIGSTKMANFSYRVGESTILGSKELDEDKCYADVTFYYGSGYSLEIARGFTYDFYYDPSAQMPCYVRRVSVDYLPSTEEGLYNLFEGSYRSESTVNYSDLKGYTYKITDRSDSANPYKIQETMKFYEGNVMYNEIEDVFDEKSYVQYKHYDATNATYEVVDTFPQNRGNNEYNRISSSNAFSARYDVVPDSDFDFKDNNDPGAVSGRGAYPVRAILKNLTHGAHYGYYFEREFMYAYRVGYSDVKFGRNISSTKNETTGEITTTIDSYVLYDSTASSTSIDRHEVVKFDATLKFSKDGAPLSILFTQNSYKLSDWSTTDEAPTGGAQPTLVKKIEGTFEYGAPYSGAPNFDKSKYFISSIDSIRFYNSQTGKPADDGKSYLHYQDKVNLAKDGNNDSLANLKEFKYTPSTALDAWQFGPTASSDENIIRRTESNARYVMTCVGIGDSTVTFGNYTKNSPTYNLSINVSATQKFHTIYLYSKWGEYASVGTDSSTSARIIAGEVTSFKVAVTPSTAPVVYTATSEKPDLLAITSANEKLTLDASGAKNITEATVVRVRIDSDWFQDSASKKYEMFEFTIIPASADPTNSNWGMVGYEDHVTMNFSNEAYTGTTASGFTAPLKGTISDDGYQDDGSYKYSISINFYYQYKGGEVIARVYGIKFSANPDGWSTNAGDYEIDFYYDVANKTMGVYLAEREYDSDIEWFVVYPLYGDCDEDGSPYSYTPFTKLEA